MSFDSKLQICFLGDSDPVDIAPVSDAILLILKKDGIHRDVFSDLKAAFESGQADFRLHATYLKQLIQSVAPLLPTAHFEARGFGEEFRHTWIATFKNGVETFSQGPWDYDEE